MKVSAIIVLYNPNLELLDEQYDTLDSQVDTVIYIDNSPNQNVRNKIVNWIKSKQMGVNYYLSMDGNVGIAKAQNKGILLAKELNSNYVLLLDQDSLLSKNMVSNLLYAWVTLEKEGMKIAAIGPSFVDAKSGEIAKIIRHSGLSVKKITPSLENNYEVADYIISSGSLIKIQNFDEIGLLKEELFIDWVDIEWGLRAKELGFSSIVIPAVIMRHSIGDEFVEFINRKKNLHADFRNYFIVRNSTYLGLHTNLPANFRLIQLFKVPLYILFYSYYSRKFMYSLMLLLNAVKDGIFKKMDKGYFQDKGL